MNWIPDRPNAPGLWLCYQNREPIVAIVDLDTPDWPPYQPYLRVCVDGESWPLDSYPWGLSPSFGPIRPPCETEP